MKKDTILKVLRRYEKSLQTMETEARMQDEPKDAEHYKFDKTVMHEAVKLIAERKE